MSESKKPPTSRERALAIVYNDGDAYRSGANGGEPLVGVIETAIDAAVEVERKANVEPWQLIVTVLVMVAFVGGALGVMADQLFDLDNRVEHAVSMSKSDASVARSEAEIAKSESRSCNDKLTAPWEWSWVENDLLATTDTFIRGGTWQLVGSVVPGYGKPVSIYRHALR